MAPLKTPRSEGRAFATPELVSAAAGMFTRRPGWDGHEGPRPVVTIAPGVVSIGWPDIARQERTRERAEKSRRAQVDEVARYIAEHGHAPERPDPSRTVSEWSRKSRARMVRTLAELDYGPVLRMGLALPMTTLTYPADWLTVAPSGKDVKRHLDQWRKAYARAWGFAFIGLWKLEFQRRGAPHIHLWGPEPQGAAGEHRRTAHEAALLLWEASGRKGRKPYYRTAVGDGLSYKLWLSLVWSEIVAHPDPVERRKHLEAGTAVDGKEGDRMTDPRRLAVYFTKHGTFSAKEYQHEVPPEWQEPGTGPGRFWGYWGLDKATAGVELEPREAITAARVLRRYARAQGVTRQVSVPRGVVIDRETGEVIRQKYRKVRRPVRRLASGAGFLCVNDGPALAAQVARAVEIVHPRTEEGAV